MEKPGDRTPVNWSCLVKLGDLVKRQQGWMGWERQRLGLVVMVDRAVVRVQWSDDYGTFLHPLTSLEPINEAR